MIYSLLKPMYICIYLESNEVAVSPVILPLTETVADLCNGRQCTVRCCTYMYIHTYTYTYMYVQTTCIYTHIHIQLHTCMSRLHVYTHIYMYIHVCPDYMYIHTYTYTYIHVCPDYMYIYMYVNERCRRKEEAGKVKQTTRQSIQGSHFSKEK